MNDEIVKIPDEEFAEMQKSVEEEFSDVNRHFVIVEEARNNVFK